jgi:hypothetical protein
MLVIRDAQLQSFIASGSDDIELLIAQAEVRINPSRVDGIRPIRLRSMARIAMETALSVGMTKAEDIAGFAALMFEISPQFHQEPSIAVALADESFQPGERLTYLFERTTDEAWADAVKLYDQNIWFGTKPANTETDNEQNSKPVDYIELTLAQVQAVEKLAERHKSSPSLDSASQMEIEVEKLCFYQNSAKGAPKIRAKQAYDQAKALVLGRAVTQRLG